jgi:regulator of protease activity HflC (stomatin/prohibitin superfamily)
MLTSSRVRTNAISQIIGIIVILAGVAAGLRTDMRLAIALAVIAYALIILGLQMAYAWESAVVLRAGKFHKLAGPGLFAIVPVVDSVAVWIDQRVQTSTFTAEQTLTEDTVPVDVDAVLFWVVWDAKKAALEVTSYKQAVEWAAQTALRDIIGKTSLEDLLSNRQMVDEALQKSIDARSTPWGITVSSVELRDIKIPNSLQDAMSRQAQAQRESQARVILGEAEDQIAESFVRAAKKYEGNPVALHLRAMNMLYEGLKEKGAMIVVPSTAVETMGLGTIGGLAALGANAPGGSSAPLAANVPQGSANA